MPQRRSLSEILQSTSDVLFPEQMGKAAVELDSKDVDGDTPLHVMVWRGDRDAVEVLIAAGARIDAVGDMGQTPLHVAVMRADEHISELLLRAGASPNIRSEFGDTPGELAESKGGTMQKLFTYAATREPRS
jgi:uncharacterized protein